MQSNYLVSLRNCSGRRQLFHAKHWLRWNGSFYNGCKTCSNNVPDSNFKLEINGQQYVGSSTTHRKIDSAWYIGTDTNTDSPPSVFSCKVISDNLKANWLKFEVLCLMNEKLNQAKLVESHLRRRAKLMAQILMWSDKKR